MRRTIHLLVLFYLRCGVSFLLEGNTAKPSNDLTDSHYTTLLQQYARVLNMLIEEKQLRQRLEVFVTQMDAEFTNKINHLGTMNNGKQIKT